jgi:alginate O-acetyltransferase complex protein AlgJ
MAEAAEGSKPSGRAGPAARRESKGRRSRPANGSETAKKPRAAAAKRDPKQRASEAKEAQAGRRARQPTRGRKGPVREATPSDSPPCTRGEVVLGPDVATGTLIAFNHLPNTGGGSMREVFRPAVTKEGNRKTVSPFDLSHSAKIKQLWTRTVKARGFSVERLRYVAGPQVGHVVARLERPVEIYTLLRDPVDLVASAARRLGLDLGKIYSEGLKRPDWCNPQSRSILAGFVELDSFTASFGPGEDADAWRTRLAAIASEYYRFGTRERFLDSARLFAENLPLTRAQMAAINVTTADPPQPLSAELVETIRAANWLDIELYEQFGELPATDVGRRASRLRVSAAKGWLGTPPGSFTGYSDVDWKDVARKQELDLAWLRLRVTELERRLAHDGGSTEPARELTTAPAVATANGEPRTEPDLEDKVIRGKNGWLYLGGHDTNRVVDQITGRRKFSEEEVDTWATAIRERQKIAQAAGAAYVMIVPPNQHSVYPEYLPDEIELSDGRPVMQLAAEVEGDPEAPFVYPVEAMRDARDERPTYGPKDSHWNDWGAFVGYRVLCDALEAQGVTLRRVTPGDLNWSEIDDRGDLGIKVEPNETALQPVASIATPRSRLVFDNRIRNRGRELIYECEGAPGKALVFGDSFGYVAIKYLSETFGRLVYAHMSQAFDETLLARERPSAVVTIINERFLVQLPRANAPTLAEIVEVKTSRGFLMTEEDARRQKQRTLRGHVLED